MGYPRHAKIFVLQVLVPEEGVEPSYPVKDAGF